MIVIKDSIKTANDASFFGDSAEAYVCQNLVLIALSFSSLCKNATIKGGVVMRNISKSARRATQDIDIDFVRYSLNDKSIDNFVSKLNNIPGLKFEKFGKTEELKQQDYHGKRIHIKISDFTGYYLETKIDLGVHNNLCIEQEEYCFDIAGFNGVSLLINSKEQMFVEKIRSLLKFGPNSTRYKDIFDLCYLIPYLNKEKLMKCIDEYIFLDSGMKEKTMDDIKKRISNTFYDVTFRRRLSLSHKNWLDKPIDEVLAEILAFFDC